MSWFSRLWNRSARGAGEVALAPVRHALAGGDPDGALLLARRAASVHGVSDELLRAAAAACLALSDAISAELFARAADTPGDPARLVELGMHLIEQEAYDLAGAVLERALESAPLDAMVR